MVHDEHQDIEAELRDYLELQDYLKLEDWQQARGLDAFSQERARDYLEILNRVVELQEALQPDWKNPNGTALDVIEAAAFAGLRDIARIA